MASKNVILTDKYGSQIAPATTAEQVQWDSSTNLKQKINSIIAGGTGGSSGNQGFESVTKSEIDAMF